MSNQNKPACDCQKQIDQTDEQLLKRMAQRDEIALREFISRYAAQVTRVCSKICFDEHVVNSLVSEVFWEIWHRSTTYDSSRGSVRTFLMIIARSKSVDQRRSDCARQRQRSTAANSYPHENRGIEWENRTDDSLTRAETASKVRMALSGLPKTQRRAIELAFFDGFTHEQVAEQLAEPLGTIKTRIRQGLKKLRTALASHERNQELQ
ncbi:MAG: sigma-70 family RNA polymerase sigma factor [Planctomycetales bacterium]|nr:sigma-70 family RNA polymerase sigma factor [Planctomycetales bacterium]